MRAHLIHVWLGRMAAACWLAAGAWAGTFGNVVPVGGHAADIALDEARGLLYIANFTANRVEVMSTADNTIRTSFNVAPQPGALAISPDGQYLLVAHYGVWAAPNTSKSALTVINLNDNSRQTVALGAAPLGVAFGADGLALVVTATDLLLFDPVSGATQALSGVAELAAKVLPVKVGETPVQIVAASVTASADGMFIYGLAELTEGVMRYRYDLRSRRVAPFAFISSPPMGPRVMSVSRDGSYYATGWGLFNASGMLISQFPNATGALNIGSHVIDSDSNTIYAQIPEVQITSGPVLQILDADNLTVRERLNLPENLAGRSVLNSARDVVYAVSDSGVLVMPVGALSRMRRVRGPEDVLVRGNFCDRRTIVQQIAITDPGGGHTDFSLSAGTPGLTITPSSGVTPATVEVRVDPNAFTSQNGTTAIEINIRSVMAVNLPAPIRLLVNNRNPDQRGTFINVPGKLVDLLADPARDRFYLLRQDTNQVLVFEGSEYRQIATLRTFNTPMQMAVTFDRKYLLVGHDNSQFIARYDLDTLEAVTPVMAPFGHYPRSVAASGKAVLAASRLADGTGSVENVDLTTNNAVTLPSLGVYENKVSQHSVLAASPNGATILLAMPDGNVMLYSANSDTFVASRKDFKELNGAYAASSYDQYAVGNSLLNASLVPVVKLETGTGASSGFAYVDQFGLRATASAASAAGVMTRVMATGEAVRPTRIAEAPLLPPPPAMGGQFTRTIAPLYHRRSIVALTTSGFTVLAWDYDAAVAPPRIERVVNAADLTQPIAPGGLITITGRQFTPVNVATREMPLPTALGESCLMVNGVAVPMLFASPNQINAQLPFNVDGSATMVLRTPGGVSDNFYLTILPAAPSVFRSGQPGLVEDVPTVFRAKNGELVTGSNPIHPEEVVVIYLTGMGRTDPAVEPGMPAPSDPLPRAVIEPTVTLGGVPLIVGYAGLAPGQVGVYQINAYVPANVPLGMDMPLVISQGGSATTLPVRVVK